MRPLAVLVAGDPIARVRANHGSYADIIRERISAVFSGPVVEVELRDGSPLPPPDSLRAAVITGSAASVTERAPWMLRAEEYLRELRDQRTPTLGICFGHQLLGQALGGEVQKNPSGREIGTVDLVIDRSDPLLSHAVPPHRVNATHVDTVVTLPPGAHVLARTELEPHAAVRFADAVWGVQFHPEMDGSIIRAFLEERRALLENEGLDAEALLRTVDDAPAGASVLRRFVEMVLEPVS